MNIPDSIYIECPRCGETTLHEVLKGRMGKRGILEATVRCQECGDVHVSQVRSTPLVAVGVVVSEGDRSNRTQVDMDPDEPLKLRDEMFIEDLQVSVTGIELKDGRRVSKASAEDVATLWTKRFDKIPLKVSINNVHKTYSREITAAPDEEFYIGDMMKVGRDDIVIHGIKVRHRMIRNRGGAEARDIVRIYAKSMRKTYA